MNARVPTRRRGILQLLVFILIAFLVAGPALGKVQRQEATEGDPGDGNLGPCDAEAFASGGGSGSVVAALIESTEAVASTRSWYFPVILLPSGQVLTLDPGLWPVILRHDGEVRSWSPSLHAERGFDHAR